MGAAAATSAWLLYLVSKQSKVYAAAVFNTTLSALVLDLIVRGRWRWRAAWAAAAQRSVCPGHGICTGRGEGVAMSGYAREWSISI